VLDTYFIFLRSRVLAGKITLEREQEIVMEVKDWLTGEAEKVKTYQTYLANWQDWGNPWTDSV